MASRATTVEFIAEQVSGAGVIAMRKMFGEYAIYCDIKLTALVCDDRLVVKPTKAGRTHIGEVAEQPPYHGAKAYYLISGDLWDDRDWLTTLIRISAAELPLPAKSRRVSQAR